MPRPTELRPVTTLKGLDFLGFRRVVVYAWLRNGHYLYIGYSSAGISRLFGHNVINKIEPVKPTDTFLLWWMNDVSDAVALEFDMIQTYTPKYNVKDNDQVATKQKQPPKPRHCVGCGKEFIRSRPWQVFCTKACQEAKELGVELKCTACSKVFTKRRRHQRFCSPRCRVKHWQHRHPRSRIPVEE